jgi:hypothetical protein
MGGRVEMAVLRRCETIALEPGEDGVFVWR